MSLTVAVYRPRNPQLSDYYRCVEDYFETFVQIYADTIYGDPEYSWDAYIHV